MDVAARDELIAEMEQGLRRLRLTAPAIMLLEANKPFSFIVSQLLLAAGPALALLWGSDRPGLIAQFLEDRANVELLIQRLEASPQPGPTR